MIRKKITIITDEFYQKNRFFDEFDKVSNRDDCLRPWIELKKSLANDNISIDTVDITPVSNADIVIFLNVPSETDQYYIDCISKNKTKFCVITELGFIHKNNLRLDLIKTFNIVFTYQTDLVDNKNIFKLNYTFDFKKALEEYKTSNLQNRKNLSNLIAGNKTLKHPNELYSKRLEIINWYKKYNPEKLDLYGRGWNQKTFFNRFTINLKYLGFLKSLFSNYYISYKGAVENKSEILKKYKFSFTLENAIDTPGWITEKIFDSLFNGCIPIYLGALEINKYVDEGCYIDLRKFNSINELHEYITTFSETKFIEYQNSIYTFLKEKSLDEKYEFGLPYFLSTFKKHIFNYLEND